MKISEMTNEQAAETLIRLSVPFGNICEDQQAVELIDKYLGMNGRPNIQKLGRMFSPVVTFAFKTHKADLYEIVGALTFRKASEVAKAQFLDTVKVLRESYDEVLKSFFTSSVEQIKDSAGKQSATSSDTATMA